MKIGIVIKHCSKRHASKYILEISQYFAKKGHEVHIFANTWDEIKNKRIHFHKIPAFFSNFHLQEAFLTLFATITQKFYKFDVTLAQPTRYFIPNIAEMQFVYKNWNDYRDKNNIPVPFADRLLPFMEKFNIRRAKQIIAISKSIKHETIKHYKIPEKKISVIYNSVNIKDFHPENKSKYSDEIRKKHGIKNNELVILFVGNPFVRKGLKYVIEALPRIKTKNYKLLIIGRDDTHKQPYVEMIDELGLNHKTIWIGLTTEIKKYFATSDIFVLPTLYEPFGIVIIEAMASGLPVVVSKLAGAAELIDDGKDGLLLKNPRDSNEITQKLSYLINSGIIRKQMGKKARMKSEKYTWEKAAEQMLEVFKKATKC